LSSSRRVKKGPGRRPQSAKRQRFMELRARGWSVRAAAREVGVSRSAATNWTRGYKTYRNGVEVGFVPPLDRLAVRQISSRYLSQDERIEIADLRQSGLSLRAIASRLERAPSTISRELRRNAVAGRGYRPFEAHQRATVRRHVTTGAGSTSAISLAPWSPSCLVSGGARSRSAVIFDCASPTTRRCGCVTKVSIKLCTYRIRAFCGPRGWHRTVVHRYVPVVIIASPTSISSAGDRGFSGQCSPSTTGRSRWTTAPCPDTGNLNGVVKPPEPVVGVPPSTSGSRAAAPIGRRCGGGPGR
jgi:transposase